MALRASMSVSHARSPASTHASPPPVAAASREPAQDHGPTVRPRLAQLLQSAGGAVGASLAAPSVALFARPAPHAAGQQGGAIVQRNGKKKGGYLDTMFNLYHGMKNGPSPDHQWNSQTRETLNQATHDNPSLHAEVVKRVNQGLDKSNVSLSDESHARLSNILKKRSTREIGQTSAHLAEVGTFARGAMRGDPYAKTGIMMNLLGALNAGATEHSAYKTGNFRKHEEWSAN